MVQPRYQRPAGRVTYVPPARTMAAGTSAAVTMTDAHRLLLAFVDEELQAWRDFDSAAALSVITAISHTSFDPLALALAPKAPLLLFEQQSQARLGEAKNRIHARARQLGLE